MRNPDLLHRAREMRTNPTPPEARLWYHLRAKRFEATKFRQQTVIDRYIVDFTSRTAMLAIELDGDTHAHQASYDAARDQHLRSKGFRILRFTNSEVMANIEGVLATIAEAIKSRPSPPSSSPPSSRPSSPPSSPSPLQGRGPGRGA